MKKGLKLFCILLIAFIFSGCSKINYEITINKDKSMDLYLVLGLSKDFDQVFGEYASQYGDVSFEEYYESQFGEEIKAAKEAGLDVKEYEDDNFKGNIIIRHFNSIDDLSSDKDTKFDLAGDKIDTKKFFKKSDGFFKETYNANLVNSNVKKLKDQIDSYSHEDQYSKYVQKANEMLELKMVLNVPNKAGDNNATSVENGGKKLIWDLKDFSGNVNFEFYMYKTKNIVLCISGVVGLILVIVIIIVIIKKKKNNKNIPENTVMVETLDMPTVIPESTSSNDNSNSKTTNNNYNNYDTSVVELPSNETILDNTVPLSISNNTDVVKPDNYEIPKTENEEIVNNNKPSITDNIIIEIEEDK